MNYEILTRLTKEINRPVGVFTYKSTFSKQKSDAWFQKKKLCQMTKPVPNEQSGPLKLLFWPNITKCICSLKPQDITNNETMVLLNSEVWKPSAQSWINANINMLYQYKHNVKLSQNLTYKLYTLYLLPTY